MLICSFAHLSAFYRWVSLIPSSHYMARICIMSHSVELSEKFEAFQCEKSEDSLTRGEDVWKAKFRIDKSGIKKLNWNLVYCVSRKLCWALSEIWRWDGLPISLPLKGLLFFLTSYWISSSKKSHIVGTVGREREPASEWHISWPEI